MDTSLSKRGDETILYLGSVLGVLAGFTNLFLNRGIIYSYNTGFSSATSVVFILWGLVMFFSIKRDADDSGDKKLRRRRRVITLLLFISVILDALFPYSSEGLFQAILLSISFWFLYRMFTFESLELIDARDDSLGSLDNLRTLRGVQLVSIFHYICGAFAVISGVYLSVSPHTIRFLEAVSLDVIMAIMLSGLIFLLLGFAISRGSKVIRFFDELLWVAVLFLVAQIGQRGIIHWAVYLLIIPSIIILDYLFFDIRSRRFFERMS